MTLRVCWLPTLAALAALPWLGLPPYFLHLLIVVLIWSFVYTAWSLMAKCGLVSLGHGAFLGVGAYASALLWNLYGLSPLAGTVAGMMLAVLLAIVVGYPCFRLRVIGHQFALVTLALAEVVRLAIIAARDITGGSLGMTPNAMSSLSWSALQFSDKKNFYVLVMMVWLFGLWVWWRIDRSVTSAALSAISEDEDAAASVGIDVTWEKLKITIISAAMTAMGGALYGQYLMYLNPDTLAGVGVSLQMVFAVIVGGVRSLSGPTIGAFLTIALSEGLRVAFGTTWIGIANTIYGILLILFIIYMPRGLAGLIGKSP
jgi:branched-chain amino acid transport system permease protein